jgi:hypothetical protein
MRIASGAGLDLAQVVSEPIFNIPRLLEAARRERFDPFLGGGSTKRLCSVARRIACSKSGCSKSFMSVPFPCLPIAGVSQSDQQAEFES